MSDRACEVYDWDKELDLDELRRLMDMQATALAQALAGLEELAGRGSTMSMVFWPMRTETGSEQTSILCRLGNGSRALQRQILFSRHTNSVGSTGTTRTMKKHIERFQPSSPVDRVVTRLKGIAQHHKNGCCSVSHRSQFSTRQPH